MKKIIYIDLDDVLANFKGSDAFKNGFDVSKMHEPGFFLNLKPVKGSQVAVRQLIKMGFDIQILSQPVAESAHCYMEKVQWVGMYFPELINKINLTQDKSLFRGDYLIDDNAKKWEMAWTVANNTPFIQFYPEAPECCWAGIVLEFKQRLSQRSGQ